MAMSIFKTSKMAAARGGNKFVSYIHKMEKLHNNAITIYETTRHLQSLDVTLHH